MSIEILQVFWFIQLYFHFSFHSHHLFSCFFLFNSLSMSIKKQTNQSDCTTKPKQTMPYQLKYNWQSDSYQTSFTVWKWKFIYFSHLCFCTIFFFDIRTAGIYKNFVTLLNIIAIKLLVLFLELKYLIDPSRPNIYCLWLWNKFLNILNTGAIIHFITCMTRLVMFTGGASADIHTNYKYWPTNLLASLYKYVCM